MNRNKKIREKLNRNSSNKILKKQNNSWMMRKRSKKRSNLYKSLNKKKTNITHNKHSSQINLRLKRRKKILNKNQKIVPNHSRKMMDYKKCIRGRFNWKRKE